MLSKDVAAFLLSLVNGLTINVGAPDFQESVELVTQAKKELVAFFEDNL